MWIPGSVHEVEVCLDRCQMGNASNVEQQRGEDDGQRLMCLKVGEYADKKGDWKIFAGYILRDF